MASKVDKGQWFNDVYLKITKSKFYFRQVGGWAIDSKVIDGCSIPNAQIWLAVDDECGKAFYANLDLFIKYGKRINYEGQGEQVVLPMQYWKIVDNAKEEIGSLVKGWRKCQ